MNITVFNDLENYIKGSRIHLLTFQKSIEKHNRFVVALAVVLLQKLFSVYCYSGIYRPG